MSEGKPASSDEDLAKLSKGNASDKSMPNELVKWMEELHDPAIPDELKAIISKMNAESPISDTLLKGKYQILLLEKLLPWQNPVGSLFQTSLGVCFVEKRHILASSEKGRKFSPNPDELPQMLDFQILYEKSENSEFILLPLDVNIGRKILSIYKSIKSDGKKRLPLIALCYGENPKSMVLLGSLVEEPKIARLIVTNEGSVSKEDHLPSMSSLKTKHLEGFISSISTVKVSAFARYDVYEREVRASTELQPSKDMRVFVECIWTDVSYILEPVSADCICTVNIKTVSGNDYTGAFNKFKEIKLIEALFQSYQTGVMIWPNCKSSGNVMKKVQNLISGLTIKENPMLIHNKLESFDCAVLEACRNLDFTDKLWLILKDLGKEREVIGLLQKPKECSSNEQLIEALTYVFDALKEINPPLIYKKKKSTVAVIARNLQKMPLSCPVVDEKLAKQMLLEIGIEKLQQDYVALFVGMELASLEETNYFLQPDLFSPEAISCIKKLHCVLELSIIGLKSLGLCQMLLRELVRIAMSHYASTSDIDLQHFFSFQIPLYVIRPLLNKLRPTIWELSLLSSDGDYVKQSVHHFFTTPTVEHIFAPKSYHPMQMLKTASYVYLKGVLVQDLIPGVTKKEGNEML